MNVKLKDVICNTNLRPVKLFQGSAGVGQHPKWSHWEGCVVILNKENKAS